MKVKANETSTDVICAECGSAMVLRRVRVNAAWAKRHPIFYGCSRFPECRGSHGAHPNGEPMGKPADAQTKLARVRAHTAFDKLWKRPHNVFSGRGQAYKWLAQEMGSKSIHIGECDEEQCKRIACLASDKLADEQGRKMELR